MYYVWQARQGTFTWVGKVGWSCVVRTRQISLSPLSLPRSVVHRKRMMGCRVGSWASITAGSRQLRGHSARPISFSSFLLHLLSHRCFAFSREQL